MSNKIINQLLKSRVLSKARSKSLSAATPIVEDPTLQTWIKEVSSTIKDVAGSSVRKSDLVRAGIVTINNGELQNALTPNEEVNLTIPAAVVNLAANGAYSSITLDWETKPSKYFGQNTIYRSDVDDFGTATQIGSTLGDVYTDYVGNHIKAYYWVRTISKFGVEGDLAPSVYAETAIDVAYVMDQISGQIDKSHLNQLLQSEIGKITQNTSDLINEIKNRAAAVANLANQLRLEAEARVNDLIAYIDTEVLEKTVAEAQARAVAIAEEASKRTTELLAKANELKTEFTALNAQRIQDILLLNDGLTSEVTSRKAGDAANLTALNNYKTSNNAALSNISETLSTAVDTGQATAEKVTALDTRLTTNEQVSSTALTKAESAVTSNSALASKVDNLAAIITDIGEGAETNVDVYAFNALKVEVNAQGDQVDTITSDLTTLTGTVSNLGNITNATNNAVAELKTQQTATGTKVNQQGESITLLQNSVATLNDDLATKVDSETFDSLTSQVTQDRANITAQGQSITNIQNNLETTNNKINTKADASALTATDSKVANIDDRTTTNTNDTTDLKGRMSTVENGLSTKADVSALNNIYTKTQSDAKAIELAAGEISKYDATLITGGKNYAIKLQNGEDFKPFSGSVVTVTPNLSRLLLPLTLPVTNPFRVKITGGTSVVLTAPVITFIKESSVFIGFKVKNESTELLRFAFNNLFDIKYFKGSDIVNPGEEKEILLRGITRSNVSVGLRVLNPYNTNGGAYTELSFLMAEVMAGVGTIPSNWIEPVEIVKSAIEVNATAITTTNAEVVRVDGKTTVNANEINGLTSRMSTVEGQVSTKAEASALQNYYTKTEAATNATTVAAGEVAKYDASLKVGGENLWSLDEATIAKEGGNAVIEYIDRNKEHYKVTISSFRSTDNLNLIRHDNMLLSKSLADVDKNSQYTLSFEIRAIKAGRCTLYAYFNGANTVPGIDVTTEWQRFEFTPASKPAGTGATLTSQLFAFGLNTINGWAVNDWYEVRHIQMQKGTKATAFSKATLALQNALDANATAIQSTNTELTKVDGKVTANSNSITSLNSSVSNLENTKLNASVIAGYYTKSETDSKVETVTAGRIEAFKSSIENSVEAIKILPLQATVANILRPNNPDFNNISLVQDSTTNASHVLKVTGLEGGVNIFAAENVPFNPNRLYRVKYRLKRVAGTGIVYPAVVPMNMYKTGGITSNNTGLNINTISSVIYPLAGTTTAMPLNVWVEGDYYIKGQSAGASTGAGTLTSPRTMPNFGAYLRLGFICPIRTDFLIEYFILEEADDDITADALITTNAEVSRIDGALTSTANNIISLSSSVQGLEQDNLVLPFKDKTYSGAAYLQVSCPLRDLYYMRTGEVYTVRGKVSFDHPNALSAAQGLAIYLEGAIRFTNVALFKQGDNQYFEGTITIPAIVDGRSFTNLNFYFLPSGTAVAGTKTTVHWAELRKGDQVSKVDLSDYATANALSSTNTEVSRINGVVNTQATQLTSLSAGLSRQEDVKSLAYDYETKDADSWIPHYGGRSTQFGIASAGGGKVSPTSYYLPEGVSGSFMYNAKRLTNDRKYRVSFWARKSSTATAANYITVARALKNGNFTVSYYTYVAFALSTNGEWQFISVDIDFSFSQESYPYLYLGFSVNNGNANGWSEVQGFRIDEVTILPDMSEYATATAVSSLTTEVSRVNGVATSAANSTTLLTSRMGAAENKLLVQGKVTDGVRSSYVVKMETGNVVGGFGMVQETGALGNVITSFGVNADTFFIGSPTGNKKPFAVLGTSGLINGVTVPAGTYIDTAYIPNGTITNAKIGDLSADKITTGSIAADRMKANIVAAAQGQFTTLSALSAKIGVLRTATSGARTEIKDNLIEVYDSSGKLRVRLGVWS